MLVSGALNQRPLPQRTTALAFAASLVAVSLFAPAPAAAFEHTQALSTGYDYTFVAADSGGRYQFHSLPLTYRGRFGGALAANFRLGVSWPYLAHQNASFYPGGSYDSAAGVEAALGPTYRLPLRGLDLDVGAGFHFSYLRLVSDEFVEWSSATAGFGFSGALRFPVFSPVLGAQPLFGVHADLDFDVADFSRGGDLSVGVHAAIAASLGLRWGDKGKAPPKTGSKAAPTAEPQP